MERLNREIFKKNIQTLKRLSYDSSNEEYMTESDREAINFDKVKTAYTAGLHLSDESAKSVDGVLQAGDEAAFIEFKNGKVKSNDIKEKMRDSLLIYCDIVKETISDTREYLDFILVYNEEKNGMQNESKSRNEIVEHFMGKAQEELIRFDLEKYKKTYFKNIHTYHRKEFEEYLRRIK